MVVFISFFVGVFCSVYKCFSMASFILIEAGYMYIYSLVGIGILEIGSLDPPAYRPRIGRWLFRLLDLHQRSPCPGRKEELRTPS